MSKGLLSSARTAHFLLAIAVLSCAAQEVPAAPVPAQIASAKRIFIANAGTVTSYYMVRNNWYSGGPNRVYNEFYAGMKSWAHYEIVSAPADADLVFEISCRDAGAAGGSPITSLQFTVKIIDPKLHATLWSLIEHSEPAAREKNREKNYETAMAALIGDVKALVSPPEPAK